MVGKGDAFSFWGHDYFQGRTVSLGSVVDANSKPTFERSTNIKTSAKPQPRFIQWFDRLRKSYNRHTGNGSFRGFRTVGFSLKIKGPSNHSSPNVTCVEWFSKKTSVQLIGGPWENGTRCNLKIPSQWSKKAGNVRWYLSVCFIWRATVMLRRLRKRLCEKVSCITKVLALGCYRWLLCHVDTIPISHIKHLHNLSCTNLKKTAFASMSPTTSVPGFDARRWTIIAAVGVHAGNMCHLNFTSIYISQVFEHSYEAEMARRAKL